MSNETYDKLHKLVAYLIQHDILSKARICSVIDMELKDFIETFDDLEREDV